MNILLLSAIIGESTGHLKHGIGMISAVLKKSGHDVEVIHDGVFTKQQVEDAEVIGISGLTSSIGIIKDMAAQIKEAVAKGDGNAASDARNAMWEALFTMFKNVYQLADVWNELAPRATGEKASD